MIYGIIFALAAQPKNLPMYQPPASLDITALEKMYLREIEILKFKLLSGAFWKDIAKQKNKTIQLALILHKKQCNASVDCSHFTVEEV